MIGWIPFRIGDHQDLAFAFDEQVVENRVVLLPAVGLRIDDDRGRVFVVAGCPQVDRERVAALSGRETNLSFGNRLAVFGQHQATVAVLQAREHHVGLVGLAELDVARQFESLDPDFGVVTVLDRHHVDGNTACLKFIEDAAQVSQRFGTIADQNNPSPIFLGQHRRRERQRLLEVGGVAIDQRVEQDAFLERRCFGGRQFDRRVPAKDHQPGLVALGFS